MAKTCVNCGAKISRLEESYHVKYSQVDFCKKCMNEPQALLEEIKLADTFEKYRVAAKKLKNALKTLELNKYSKECLRYDFDVLAAKAVKKYDLKITACPKKIHADFKTCYDVICEIGKLVSGETSAYEPIIFELEGTINAIFTFEMYSIVTGCYESMTVSLVCQNGASVITVIGTGGTNKILNPGYGLEIPAVNEFWATLIGRYPEFDYEDCALQKVPEKPLNNRIGILGGTFDPPHNGHVALAKAATDQGRLEKLIVMPAKVQPFKLGRKITDGEQRIEMTKLAYAEYDNIEVSDYEVKNTSVSYTYDTLNYLKTVYPDKQLYFIMGTDSFMELDTWYKGTDILQNFSFMVSVRPGYKEDALENKIMEYRVKYGSEVIKITSPMPNVSSTEIKARRSQNLSITDMVPEKVERYINEHKLYL